MGDSTPVSGALGPVSGITFLYFDDLVGARAFFTEILGDRIVVDHGWVAIWQAGPGCFIGAVDAKRSSIPLTSRGGMLVSLNVHDVPAWHERIRGMAQGASQDAPYQVTSITPITINDETGDMSFFFKGPEGYDFEIQEFLRAGERKTFLLE